MTLHVPGQYSSLLTRILIGISLLAFAGSSISHEEEEHEHDHDEFEQHGAHEHGKVTLNVALDGRRLSIELHAPADNVIGFEHAPKTDAEKAALREKSAWLQAGKGLFAFPVEAACRFRTTELEIPQWNDGSHADLEVRVTYECAQPQRLDWLQVSLLSSLKSVSEARVNVLTTTRQGSDTVKSASTRVRLR